MWPRDREPSAPGHGSGGTGAAPVQGSRTTTATRGRARRRNIVQVKARVHHADGTTTVVEFSGRPAQVLGRLIGAGDLGITSLDLPHGWRVSHFVFVLRRGGVPLETVREEVDGVAYGRYRLTRPVSLVQPWHEGGAA